MISEDLRHTTATLRLKGAAALADPAFFRGLIVNLELIAYRTELLERLAVPAGAMLSHLPPEVASLDEARARRAGH